MKRIFVTLLLSAMVLAACDRKDLVLWSPDGKRVAVVASDGLRIGDETGKLNSPLLRNAKFCRWLPDSIRAIVVSSQATTSWKDVDGLLSTAEHKAVKRIADKVWKTCSLPKAKSDQERQQQSEALLYLMHTHGAKPTKIRLHRLINYYGQSFASIDIDSLQLLDLSDAAPSERKVLWRTTQTISDMRISPDGALVAVCIDTVPAYKLVLLPVKGGQPITAVQSLADCPDWSRDGKSLFYISYSPIGQDTTFREMSETTKRPFLATLNCLEVADSEGKILSKLGTPKELVDVFSADVSQVRCLPDGSIIFHAKNRAFPSIKKSEPHFCLFKLTPDLKTVEPIVGSAELPGDEMNYFEPNPDGTKIVVPGSHGEVAVVEISSGKVTTLEKAGKQDLKFSPQWRTNDELCYAARNSKRSANGHDVEVVLQSVTQLDQQPIALSKDWSVSSFDFLKDPKDTNEKERKATPAGKSQSTQKKRKSG